MTWQDAFLAMAGLIGGGTAVVHGVLIQRLVVRPFGAFLATAPRTPAAIKRIMPLLVHFSTIAWLLGGLALMAAHEAPSVPHAGEEPREARQRRVGLLHREKLLFFHRALRP